MVFDLKLKDWSKRNYQLWLFMTTSNILRKVWKKWRNLKATLILILSIWIKLANRFRKSVEMSKPILFISFLKPINKFRLNIGFSLLLKISKMFRNIHTLNNWKHWGLTSIFPIGEWTKKSLVVPNSKIVDSNCFLVATLNARINLETNTIRL